jgi:outer membrane protein assembly factor BamD
VIQARSFFPSLRASCVKLTLSATAVAALAACSLAAHGQSTPEQNPTIPNPAPTTTTSSTGQVTTTTTTSTTTDSTGKPVQSVSSAVTFHGRGKKKKDDNGKVGQLKNDKKAIAKERKDDALIGSDAKLPDKQLYDKAQLATKKGHFDVARLDLQTMLNTYPDSQYQMRAKLAIADSWYKEGGTAALTQAESEYRDFCVFFPNAPEAAEAQMRIGDIYFRQMDKPDRDYSKALNAETEYRRMITDYPDSKLVPQAKQRLREVQEVLAQREADIAAFYATRNNFAATIARYQTVVDTYPLYSHMDDTLIGLGDAYELQARNIRAIPTTKLNEGAKARFEKIYDGRAADAYREVVLDHAAAPHVEDAKDRLAAMGLPIPTPTPEQLAASEKLENSRRAYRVTDRMKFLIMHEPDTVLTAQEGNPTLVDPKATVAPQVLKQVNEDYMASAGNKAAPLSAPAAVNPGEAAPADASTPATPAQPLAFQPVGEANAPAGGSSEVISTPPASGAPSGTGLGAEILSSPTAGSPAPAATAPVNPLVDAATPATLPAATGAPNPNGGLKAVGPPPNAADLPPVERPAEAPDRPNTITAATPPAQAQPAAGKKGKPQPAFDKSEESSSKHKKKKGIKKIIPPNPF